jgi:hypothetical protein
VALPPGGVDHGASDALGSQLQRRFIAAVAVSAGGEDEPSVALQERDVAAFSQSSFPRWFKIQEAWQMFATAERLGPTEHVSMAFGPMDRVTEKAPKV